MRIVLDAMGSDDCPQPEVDGALQAAADFGDEIILVGDQERVQPLLDERGTNPLIRLVHAADTITMEDKGMKLALKAKRKNSQTSMALGMDLLKNGEADAFVSAGNTGGALSTAYFRLGLLAGVERPGLTVLLPVKDGFCALLDIGANPDCKPEHLQQFGVLGSVYVQKSLGKPNPRVGLMSNGEEAGKGNELIKATYPLLEASGLNFVGNIEGKELYGGEVEVCVCDGFTGNVVVKTSEAVAKLMVGTLKDELMSSGRTKIGALLARPAFEALRAAMDPDEIGAAPLLGINGLVFIGHGRSNAKAIYASIRSARRAVEANLMEALGAAIQEQLQEAST